MSEPLQALYSAVIKRHALATTYRGRVADPTHTGDARNRPCGDYVTVTAIINERVEAIRFEGEGCALCMAASSALCAAIEGQPRAVAAELARTLGDAMDHDVALTGDLAAFATARAFPSRHGCVTLAANVVSTLLR